MDFQDFDFIGFFAKPDVDIHDLLQIPDLAHEIENAAAQFYPLLASHSGIIRGLFNIILIPADQSPRMIHLSLKIVEDSTTEFKDVLFRTLALQEAIGLVLNCERVNETASGHLFQILSKLDIGRQDLLAELMIFWIELLIKHCYDGSIQSILTEFVIKNPSAKLAECKLDCLSQVQKQVQSFDEMDTWACSMWLKSLILQVINRNKGMEIPPYLFFVTKFLKESLLQLLKNFLCRLNSVPADNVLSIYHSYYEYWNFDPAYQDMSRLVQELLEMSLQLRVKASVISKIILCLCACKNYQALSLQQRTIDIILQWAIAFHYKDCTVQAISTLCKAFKSDALFQERAQIIIEKTIACSANNYSLFKIVEILGTNEQKKVNQERIEKERNFLLNYDPNKLGGKDDALMEMLRKREMEVDQELNNLFSFGEQLTPNQKLPISLEECDLKDQPDFDL